MIGLIGLAHGTSHFFHLLVPTLFTFLMASLGASWTAISLSSTVFFVISGVGQALAGFVVDRFGPLRVLLFGMLCFLAAGLLLGLVVESLLGVYLVAGLAGMGNSVLHPCDYSILNRKVSVPRLGHSFAVHGLVGNLGWGLAYALLPWVAMTTNWHVAATVGGFVALPALVLLWIFRADLECEPIHREHDAQGSHGAFAYLAVGAVWLCFTFFFLTTVAFGVVQNFAAPVLVRLYGLTSGGAALVVSTYLFSAAGGMAVGGFLAQRHEQDRIIAMVLVVAALFAVVLASQILPSWAVLPVMASIGFCTGVAGPSRDLLVRRAAASRFGRSAYGRVYGFVYSGLDAGLACAAPIFGGFMDAGRFSIVLVGIAVFQGLAVLTALRVGKNAPVNP